MLKLRRHVPNPWLFLTAREIAARDKTPAILDDPRWHEVCADTRFPDIKNQIYFGLHVRESEEMLALLQDAQYDRPAT